MVADDPPPPLVYSDAESEWWYWTSTRSSRWPMSSSCYGYMIRAKFQYTSTEMYAFASTKKKWHAKARIRIYIRHPLGCRFYSHVHSGEAPAYFGLGSHNPRITVSIWTRKRSKSQQYTTHIIYKYGYTAKNVHNSWFDLYQSFLSPQSVHAHAWIVW